MGPRGRLRLTRAASELQFIDHALTEVTRDRDPVKDPLTDVAIVMAADEVRKLYRDDQEIDMSLADTDDDADADTAPDDAGVTG